MANTHKLDTHHKALTLNLDPSIFGSFAEIGAGQEVARWFLFVGGASGTAKAISAHDEAVSDDLYGAGSRYVSKQRLEAMLDKEWAELQTRLGKTRGLQTRFFFFRRYRYGAQLYGDERCQWLGGASVSASARRPLP
jgi:hypothetical protein